VLVAKPGYAFSGLATGDESLIVPSAASGDKGISGHHGYLHTNPKMNALFVAWGAGIKKGSKIGLINNVDVPVTAAHLLGLEMKETDGKVLTEILEPAGAVR
jgi:predicted AlkP superfamily pyrophosphatase or phosphodiesterase